MTNPIIIETVIKTTERVELEEYLEYINAKYQLYSYVSQHDRNIYLKIQFLDETQAMDIFAQTMLYHKHIEDFYVDYRIEKYMLSKSQKKSIKEMFNERKKTNKFI